MSLTVKIVILLAFCAVVSSRTIGKRYKSRAIETKAGEGQFDEEKVKQLEAELKKAQVAEASTKAVIDFFNLWLEKFKASKMTEDDFKKKHEKEIAEEFKKIYMKFTAFDAIRVADALNKTMPEKKKP
ncbi:unnamed protein product [Caenorhabditis auriculariae]|uniref:SXP/RAL-2 family protein Ani s 5-like cation-binding domain-containing protein n=1 Tax=Caenorhabditis auriculariae TaxID=2777116 RepID=A0A8S1HIU4_9PELO|nr:unnamed protein product [Caenorhabditis auriculariae]